MWVPSRARFVPDYELDLESSCVPFLERSHVEVEWKTGSEAKAEWGYKSPFTSHGAHSGADSHEGLHLLRLNVELAG